MREVRMTFGEHLEELRWRIIVSLLYLAGGVTISFIYGQDLMEIALGPHRRAYHAAQRDRLIARMERTLEDLEPLRGMMPEEAKVEGKPLVAGGEKVRWEVLFAGTVTRSLLETRAQRLAEPFEAAAAEIERDVFSLSEDDKRKLASVLRALGRDESRRIIEEVSPALQVLGTGDIPRRFRVLEERIRALVGAETGERVKKLVGWGRSFDAVLESLSRFNRFFAHKEKTALDLAREGRLTIDQLHEWVERSTLREGLARALEILEESLRKIESPASTRIMVISYLESFSAYLKVAVIFGFLITIPFILYELWKFVGAGLYLHEQRYVVTFLPFSLALFVAGILFGYFALIPVGLEFLAGWGTENVELSFTLGNYIGLFFTLTLILGLVFQTPLIMIFLHKLGIVDVSTYRRMRRVSIFIGVCLAVVLTPPDPFSWSLMALPMVLLYELGILICEFLDRRRRRAESRPAVPEEAVSGGTRL